MRPDQLEATCHMVPHATPSPLPSPPQIDEYARGMISGSQSSLFEELGLYYIGPVDGHDLENLVSIMEEVKNTETVGPVLIHIITEKVRI